MKNQENDVSSKADLDRTRLGEVGRLLQDDSLLVERLREVVRRHHQLPVLGLRLRGLERQLQIIKTHFVPNAGKIQKNQLSRVYFSFLIVNDKKSTMENNDTGKDNELFSITLLLKISG